MRTILCSPVHGVNSLSLVSQRSSAFLLNDRFASRLRNVE